jgi:hypothetical protein
LNSMWRCASRWGAPSVGAWWTGMMYGSGRSHRPVVLHQHGVQGAREISAGGEAEGSTGWGSRGASQTS